MSRPANTLFLLLLSFLSFFVTSSTFVTNGYALDKTPTWFFYPTGVAQFDSKCGTWLGRDAAHGGCYYDGQYHVGVDIMGAVTDPVYPIADGTITNISSNGWGTGNVAAVVKHKLSGGGEFLAVYGHIVTTKNVGDPVTGGVPFAQIGSWPDGDHLHFGIHPSLPIPATNWGKMPNSSWPDTNGFVDPNGYISGDGTTSSTLNTIQLPQTGQTTCYDSIGNVILCAGTGQDGDIRAGEPWPNPRFVDNGDDSMTDRVTGLVWPKDGGTPTVGSCTGGSMNWYAALDYVNCLNSRGYLGHNDWRLPNVNELETLVNAEQGLHITTWLTSATWLNSLGFRNVDSSGFWSSTNYAESPYGPNHVWFVSLGYNVVGYNYKYNGSYVWPVRAGHNNYPHKTGQTTSYAAGDDGDLGRGVSWPSPRFSDPGGYTVSDNLTGLMWTKDANLMASRDPGFDTDNNFGDGSVTWQHSLDYVKKLNAERYAGYSDWRLPNRRELMSLIDRSQYYPALPFGHPYQNVQINYYWSSTSFIGSGAWKINLGDGHLDYWGSLKSEFSYYVWPVRGGQYGGVLGSSILSGAVYAAGTTTPLAGASVSIGTQTTATDQTGKYSFSPLAPGTYTVTVSKDGYTSLSETVVITSGVQSIKNFSLHPVSANDPQVVSIDSKINGFAYYLVGPTFPVDFTATVSWGAHPPGKVRFFTSTTSYEVSTIGSTATITLDMGRDFYACSTLKVVAVSSDGATSSEKSADFVVMDPPLGGLEFIPVDEGDRFFYRTGKGMAVTLFDLKLDNGRIPNNIPVLGGNAFKFSLAPKMSWNTYSTGVTDLALEADELLNISLAGLDLTLTPRVKATGAYHHPGCYRVWSGEAGAEFGVGFEKSTPFILPGPIPMPMYWKVGVRIDGEVMAGIENLNPVRLNYSGDIAPALRGALGVGADQKFSAEGWLKGSGDFLLQYPQEPHLKDVLVNIDAGITAYCLGMTWEFNALHWDWEMNGAASLSAASLRTPAMIQQASGPSLLPRDYLKIQGSGVLQRKSTPKLLSLMTDGQAYAVTTTTLASATLPYSETRLSSSGDKMSLLYISDNPSRSAINRSMAVFTRYDGGTWGVPQPLNDDGTADFHPSAVTFSDGTVVATWEDEKIVQPDAASFDDLVKNLEISAGVYNPVAGTWQPVRLSENGFIDASPLVSGFSRDNVLLVWLANTANNLTGSSAQPNIIRFSRYNGVTWSAPQNAGSIPYGLVKYSLAYDGGKGWVVLSLDTDGDPATINDHELFVMTFDNGLWSGLTRLTTNTVPDDNPQLAFDPAGNLVLTWLQGAEVSSALNLDLAQRSVIRAEQEYSSNLADFKLSTTPDGKVALTWAQPSPTNSSDLFAAFYDPIFQKWGAPRQMTSDPETERQITATFFGPETFMAVYNKTLLGPPPVAPTDLVMITHTLGTDLGLDPTGLTAAPPNPVIGGSVALTAKAMNQGDKPLTNITVAFYLGDPATGTKLGETVITEVMAPGDTRDVTFAWTVPPTTTPLTIFAVIDPDSALDPVNRSNNSASLTIVKPDLTVSTVSWEKPADDIAVVIARIANTGSLPTPVNTVTFRNGSATGTVLYTRDIPGLGPGAALDVEYVWDLATFSAPYHTAVVTVDEANLVAEFDETDNSGSVTFPGKQQDLMKQVSVSRAGTGGGRVTSSPVGVDCGTTCSGTFVWNTPVSLTASPDQYSLFTGWSGVSACGASGDCAFTITDPATVTATFTFDTDHSVRVDGTPDVFHPSLQSAFDKAATGAVVRAWAVPFTGGLTLNNPVALRVYGGYDAAYTTRPGYTTINGKLTIGKGSLVADRITVK